MTEPQTEPTTEPQTEPTTNPTISSYQFDLNAVVSINNFVQMLLDVSTGPWALPIGAYVAEYGSTITVSGSCHPNYRASIWEDANCADIKKYGMCEEPIHLPIVSAQQIEDGSWATYLHCPECGCTTTDVPNLNDIAAEDSNRKPVDESDFLEQLHELFN